jgi:hypothetical protein
MNKLYDLLSKLTAIEEDAKRSDIPAVQRKAQAEKQGYKDTWKVTKKELDAEEHEGKISHPTTLAKNSGRADEGMEDEVSDVAPEESEVATENHHDDGMSDMDRIIARHHDAVENFKDGGELGYDLESDLWEYYFDNGQIKNYDADAGETIAELFADYLGLSEASDATDAPVAQVSTDLGGAGASDESIEECGGDMEPQGGKVSMSMQDLLALMTQLQKGPVGHHGDEPLMGDEEEEYAAEEFGNELPGDAGSQVKPVAAVTATGNDMFSKGKEAPKVNGGGNPMESQLAELYAQVKARQLDELSNDTLKSYTKKAADNMNDKAYSAGHAAAKGDNRRASSNDTKAYKRLGGITKAVDKMSLKEANQVARKLRK